MAFVSEMVDQLRDLLNDATDTQISYANKKLWLNRGIRLLWPNIYRIVVDTSITVVADTYDYTLPAAVMDGVILAVEAETGDGDNRFIRFEDYDIIEGDEDVAGVFRFTTMLPETGVEIRIRYAAPVPIIAAASYAAAQSEVWTGPDRALNLPVLYAMGMIASRRIDDRQDHTRYSTTQAINGVTDQDIMAAMQLWMGQFELELDKWSRPFPIVRD
jgi:hypothetical protein